MVWKKEDFWTSTCFNCGFGQVPEPGMLCDGCAREHPDHVKNDYWDTWSSERREAYRNDPVTYGFW